MKVKLTFVVWTFLIANCYGVGIQPQTFAGVVDGFGRITNSIKETSAWKRFNGLTIMQERPRQFMRVVQDFVRTLRQDERVLVKTKNGYLRGRFQPYKTGTPGGYYSFQGIRYGKAPVGNRRFRAALPEESWKGIRMAVREGSSCPHRNMVLERYRGGEDCLFLNVYSPQLAREKKLPVLFWIHGGAFTFGNGNAFLFGADYFMESNDIILVTINYRLGALGFLNTGTADAPGNAGLKDQILALKWVRDNIEFFGGDPEEITIGGQSAGAASVHYLMMSPLGKGLFKRAIAQSGVTLNPWSATDVTAERAFKLGNVLNFVTNDTDSLVQFLRKVSAQQLVDSAQKTLTIEDARMNVGFPFVPTIEKEYEPQNDTHPEYDQPFITEQPLKLLEEGRYNKIPMLMGFNANEAMLFIRRFKKDKTLLTQYENDFTRLVPMDLKIPGGKYSSEGEKVADRIRDFYLGGRSISTETVEEIISLFTDEMFVRGILNAARYNTKHLDNSTYVYRFAYDGALGLYKRLLNVNRPGICHGDELGYLFYFGIFNVKLDPSSSEALTKKRLLKMWTNFVKYGNPTPSEKEDQLLAVKWDALGSKDEQIPYLDITNKLEAKMNPEQERMEFWDDIYQQYNGETRST